MGRGKRACFPAERGAACRRDAPSRACLAVSAVALAANPSFEPPPGGGALIFHVMTLFHSVSLTASSQILLTLTTGRLHYEGTRCLGTETDSRTGHLTALLPFEQRALPWVTGGALAVSWEAAPGLPCTFLQEAAPDSSSKRGPVGVHGSVLVRAAFSDEHILCVQGTVSFVCYY